MPSTFWQPGELGPNPNLSFAEGEPFRAIQFWKGKANDLTGYWSGAKDNPSWIKYADYPQLTPGEVPLEDGRWGNWMSGDPQTNSRVPGGWMGNEPDLGLLDGFMDSVMSSLSEPYLPLMLSFGAGALSGASGPGDWFSGSETPWGVKTGANSPTFKGKLDLTGGVPNFGADPAYTIPNAGGSMAFDFGSYDPANPFGFGGADPTLTAGISEPFTGSGFPASGGSFGGYDFGLGYPVGGEVASSGMPGLVERLTQQVGPTVAKGLISKLMSGEATADDYAKLLGTAGSTALGVYGSNQQADALRQIAEQARTDRQPFLDKSLEWLKGGPDAYAAGPGAGALKGVLHKLSASFGNPIGSPAALGIATDSALNNWQNAVTGFGNMGLAGQDSRNSLLSSAAGADRGVTTALASGLGSLTQPDNSLEALLRKLQGAGGSNIFGVQP